MGGLSAVADAGPLIAASNARERGNRVAAELVAALGRRLLVPATVAAEVDHILRKRVSLRSARAFLGALAAGEHTLEPVTRRVFLRAAQIDANHADLDLGLVDASVMAVAEHHRLPILTFDFADFRAAPSPAGPWPLVITEQQLARALKGEP